ncbi:MAG: Gfo/Idh/MocA family protein [Trueperaceae bacterium]
MTKTICWGILGTGTIAHKFAAGLNDLPDIKLVAVGSRTQEAADTFANKFKIERRHPTYEALVQDPEVDAIYISTPHPFHKENTLLCLENGKAVLCEKPFAINAKEALEMIALARQKKVFLMEAMWSRFLPHMVKVRELLAQDTLGDVRMLECDFGFRTEVNPNSRLFNPELGGGAVLDVGIYPISLAFMLFGAPVEVKSFARLGSTGVDEEATMLFSHREGQQSLLSTATRLSTPHEATIIGTKGYIRIHSPWWGPSNFTVHVEGKKPKKVKVETPLNGYTYEALEVSQCLREGKLESDFMPLDETLAIMKTLDAIRGQWGLKYPME